MNKALHARLYAKKLIEEEGMYPEAANRLADAVYQIHKALCQCDIAHFEVFNSKALTERIDDMAGTEDLRKLFSPERS